MDGGGWRVEGGGPNYVEQNFLGVTSWLVSWDWMFGPASASAAIVCMDASTKVVCGLSDSLPDASDGLRVGVLLCGVDDSRAEAHQLWVVWAASVWSSSWSEPLIDDVWGWSSTHKNGVDCRA